MTPEEFHSHKRTQAKEAMRLAHQTLVIMNDDIAANRNAERLVALFNTTSHLELSCVAVILAASCKAVISASARMVIGALAETTSIPPPEGIQEQFEEALGEFLTRMLDPDNPETGQRMDEIFEDFFRNHNQEDR